MAGQRCLAPHHHYARWAYGTFTRVNPYGYLVVATKIGMVALTDSAQAGGFDRARVRKDQTRAGQIAEAGRTEAKTEWGTETEEAKRALLTRGKSRKSVG